MHQRDLAIGGLVEVLGSVGRIVDAWRRLSRGLRTRRPGLAVLVDSPDFQIPFARVAQRAGVPVLYYVSPQVWAWRRGRIPKLARRVDRMAAIFPFEPALYAASGLRVDFVGHPLVDPLRARGADGCKGRTRRTRAARRRAARAAAARQSSQRTRAPPRADARGRQRAAHAAPRCALCDRRGAYACSRGSERAVQAARLSPSLRLDLIAGRAHEAILACDVALAKPGTVTMEVALLDRPLVVLGRAHALTAAIARRLVAVPSLVMPNLIADAPIVPEFLQQAARPAAVVDAPSSCSRGRRASAC